MQEKVRERLENISKTSRSCHVARSASASPADLRADSGKQLVFGHFRLRDNGLEVTGRPSLDEYASVGHFIVYAEKASPFWFGDWLAYGDTREDWKERLQQAQDLTGYTEETVKRAKRTAEMIPRHRRRVPLLSYGHHKAVEALAPAQQDELLAEAIVKGWTVQDMSREVRRVKRQTVIDGQATLEGRFRVVYADPPWLYHDQGVITETDNYGRAERHYPGMTIEELCKLSVEAHTAPDAALFMWVTAPMLYESPGPRDVMLAWGFTPKTGMVWDKVLNNFGHYVSVRHEHLIIATRGSGVPDHPTPMPDSVQTIRRSDVHSEKPAEFRDLIAQLYNGPRVELFARQRYDGWTSYGNQIMADPIGATA